MLLTTDEVMVARDHRRRRKPASLLKRAVAALASRRTGSTGHSTGSMFTTPRSAGGAVTVPALDFSGWLQRAARPEDHVVLHMDIAGAEFEVPHPVTQGLRA